MTRRSGRWIATGIALAALALGLSPARPAHAHGTVTPSVVDRGQSQRFVVSVANGRGDAEIVGFRLTLPAGFEIESVEARQPRWQATSAERTISWRGGPIPRLGSESFAFRARAAGGSGSATMTGEEIFDDGAEGAFRIPLVVGSSASDGSSDTLAKAALGVALGAAAVALAALFVALSAGAGRRGAEGKLRP